MLSKRLSLSLVDSEIFFTSMDSSVSGKSAHRIDALPRILRCFNLRSNSAVFLVKSQSSCSISKSVG